MTSTWRDFVRGACLINGTWVDSPSFPRLRVVDPASQEVIGSVPILDEAAIAAAIAAAERAFPLWSRRTAADRGDVLRRLRDLIIVHRQALAELLTREQGKPLVEALGEIDYGASYIDWFAEEGKRAYGDVVPGHAPDRRIVCLKQPIGVVAAITPWNFPMAMIARKLAPALAAGCTIVVKPAEQTPLSALALAELCESAGVPPGVVNIVTGAPKTIGMALASSPVVRKISFTGSTRVGRILMEQSAATVKRMSLELGGNAPFIVFDDADIDAAVDGALASKFRNAGQTCVCTNRFYVQEGVYDEFVTKFAAAASRLQLGHGLDPATDIGPLIDRNALAKVEEHLADALGRQAKLLSGGRRSPLGGNFFEPTILADVTPEMQLAREETFGPLAGVMRFRDEAEAIALANDTEFGLAAYFFTRDNARVWRVAEALETGMVGVNTGLISTEVAPFGGVKQSGNGREGSRHGIDDYMELKYLCIAV